MKNLPAALALMLLFPPAATAVAADAPTAPAPIHYLGTINADLDISLTLDARIPDKLTGTYLYTRYGKTLFLQGKSTGHTLALTESTSTGSGTGTFALTRNADGSLAGTWKSPDGKRSLPVQLAPIAATATLHAEKKGLYTVDTGYLQFTRENPLFNALNPLLEKDARAALAANEKNLREMTAGEVAGSRATLPCTSTTDPVIIFATKSRVSLRTLVGEYTGGAHNNYGYTISNYVWRNGSLIEEKTADILKVTPAALKTLSDLCIKDLTAQKASWPGDLKFDPAQPPAINITNFGILLTFPPYEVGSFAEGTYVVSLPWQNLSGILADGAATQPP